MKLISLSCNHCGAPLEVPEKAKFVTCGFCDARLQIAHTGSSYYTEVMEAVDDIREDVAALKRHAELERLDREWEQRRAELSVTDKHGRIHRPDSIGMTVGGIGAAAFGVVWTVIAGAMFPPMALFGIIFVAVAVVSVVRTRGKAAEYQQAYAQYQSARRRLMREG